MARAWQLVIKASADDREAKRALRELGANANKVSGGVGRAFGAIAKSSALALGAGLAATVAIGVGELVDMQKASAQTAAVLKSTGGAANVTQKDVEGLAGALLAKSGVDDQVIQSGENMLLTFTNVRNEVGKGNDVFNQATKAALDMSVATGTDMKASALQLGKALNDPTKGVTKLQRVGVTFTDQQKRQIKVLQEHGHTLQAQKIILGELNKEFGGSAAAYGKTLPGMLGKIKEAFAGVGATIVAALLPAVTTGAQKLSTLVAKIQAWASSDKGQKSLAQLRDILERVGSAIGSVVGWIVKHRDGLMALGAAVLAGVAAYRAFLIIDTVAKAIGAAIVLFNAWRAGTLAQTAAQMGLNAALIANPIGIAVVAIAALVAGVVVAYKKVGWFRDAVKGTWAWIKSNWPLLLSIITGPIGAAVIYIIRHWDQVKTAAASVWKAIKSGVSSAFSFVKSHWADIVAVLTGPLGVAVLLVVRHWDDIKSGAQHMAKAVVDKLGDVVGFVGKMPGKITGAAKGMFDGIKDAFRSAINWVISKWNNLSFSIPGVDTHIPKVGKIGGFTLSTPNVPMLARGGRTNGPAIIGEDGDEQIVPLSGKYRKEGIANLLQAAAALGVPMFAKGKGSKKPAKPKPLTEADKIGMGMDQFGAFRDSRDRAFAPLDLKLATAEGTDDPNDDVAIIKQMIGWATQTKKLGAAFKPKKPGIASAQLAAERTRLQTEMTRQINGYRDQIKQLLTPPDTSTGADDGSDTSTDTGGASTDTGTGTTGTGTTDTGSGADASGGALTGVDIGAVFGDGSVGTGRAYVNATQATAGQTIVVNQQFTSEPNMGVAAQSAAWTFRTVMAGAPAGAAA